MSGNILVYSCGDRLRFLECDNEHYENLPMQYTVISKVVKNENFNIFFSIFFLFLFKT